jgi:hypothetical protein
MSIKIMLSGKLYFAAIRPGEVLRVNGEVYHEDMDSLIELICLGKAQAEYHTTRGPQEEKLKFKGRIEIMAAHPEYCI